MSSQDYSNIPDPTFLLGNSYDIFTNLKTNLIADLNATGNSEIVRKLYVDAQDSSISSALTSGLATKQNTITSGTDITLHSLNGISSTTLGYIDPTSSIQTQINAKTTVSAVQGNNNAFTGTNTFNSNIPTSTITPTTQYQLTNKAYVDAGDATNASAIATNTTNIATNTADIATNALQKQHYRQFKEIITRGQEQTRSIQTFQHPQ